MKPTLHQLHSHITNRRINAKPRRNSPFSDPVLVADLGTRYEQTKKIRVHMKRLARQLRNRPDRAQIINTQLDKCIDALKQIEVRGKR